jgi:hypothetical protein
VYTANYATALFLGGHPAGCLNVLAEARDEQHPSVVRLRAAVKKWEGTLSLWQRLNWWFGRIEPAGAPGVLDYPPGELDMALPAEEGADSPDPKSPPRRSAA